MSPSHSFTSPSIAEKAFESESEELQNAQECLIEEREKKKSFLMTAELTTDFRKKNSVFYDMIHENKT